jgi:putative hydrolase of the HAD superfamily
MKKIKAIGFDLFNTLIYANQHTLDGALKRLVASLVEDDITIDSEIFKSAHEKAAADHIKQARESGKETHNRFWISKALKDYGYSVDPDDPIIARAVESYFSAFPSNCNLIPGTLEMLGLLKKHFHLGLLSNFTHTPAALEIIDRLDLRPFFQTVLISGELGWRKPHPYVFNELKKKLGFQGEEMIYIGDDPEPDIIGAKNAGINPVWMTFIRDNPVSTSPRLLPASSIQNHQDVPSVSSWKEFIAFLDLE